MEKIYFSPGKECLNGIISTLESAKKSIKICVFTISDNRIAETIRKMFEKGIDVKIISDNDKRFDKGADVIYLAKLGIPTRIDETKAHMHHKYAVIDDKISITGSYNWTRSAEKYNYENVIITDSKAITQAYIDEFNRLWHLFIPLKTQKLKVGESYSFKVVGKQLNKLGVKFFELEDTFGAKHLLPHKFYATYEIKTGMQVNATVNSVCSQGNLLLEPEHPYYKIGETYRFDFYGRGKRITKENKEIDVLIVTDKYQRECTILPNNEYQKSENFAPENIECKVVKLKRSKLYLLNMNK